MSVIQQVYLADSGCSIYIKGIKPDKDNEYSGEITINGNPTRLERKKNAIILMVVCSLLIVTIFLWSL